MIDITKKTFENGFTSYIIKKPNFKENYAVFAVNFGSCYDEFFVNNKEIKVPMGTAHFLEHKMFEQDNFNVTEEFSKNGAVSNAFTNTAQTAYYFSCIDNFDLNLQTLLKFVSQKAYTEKSILSEKNIIAKEIEMYSDDHSWTCYFNMLSNMYSENKVRNNIAGTLSSISEIKKSHLDICYDSFYTFDNSVLICVTDSEEETIYQNIENHLNLSKNPTAVKKSYKNDKIISPLITEKKNLFQTILNLGFKDTQFNGTILDRVCLSKILLDVILSKSSDLYEVLRTNAIIDNDISYSYNCGDDYGFSIFSAKSKSPLKFREMLFISLSSLCQKGIPGKRLNTIIGKKIGELNISLDSVTSVANAQLDLFSKGLFINDIFKYYENISEDKLNKRLKTLFDPNNSVLSIIE